MQNHNFPGPMLLNSNAFCHHELGGFYAFQPLALAQVLDDGVVEQ